MQPEEIAAIILLVLIFGAIGFFAWERHTMCVAFIEGDLLRHHATNIHASFDWFDWDRDTFTYDVARICSRKERTAFKESICPPPHWRAVAFRPA